MLKFVPETVRFVVAPPRESTEPLADEKSELEMFKSVRVDENVNALPLGFVAVTTVNVI